MVLDYAISAQKYPKVVTQEKDKFQGIRDSVFQNYVVFLRSFYVVFHMLGLIYQTFNQNKKCSLDKTGEGNVVLDYAISAQKYPKIVTQEKEKFKESPTVVFKTMLFFYAVLTSFLTCLGA